MDNTPNTAPTETTSVVTTTASVLSTPAKIRNIPVLPIAIALGLLAVLGAFLYTRGYLVAATVNGSPISRMAVISELEKQSGAAVLEAMINERLIKAGIEEAGIAVSAEDIDAKIAEISGRIEEQGSTLDEALSVQGMTMDMLKEQLVTQIGLEKMFMADITVTDEEVDTYLKESGITIPEGMDDAEVKTSLKEQILQSKFQEKAAAWVEEITSDATIKQYVSY